MIPLRLIAIAALSLTLACGPSAGDPGQPVMLPIHAMSGGILFAAKTLPGSGSYDLWWAPKGAPGVQQKPVQLTSSDSDEIQPTVARAAKVFAYARPDGIFVVGEDRIPHQVSKAGERERHLQPALSHDGLWIAWVQTTYHDLNATPVTSQIMLRSVDGRVPTHAVHARPGILQLAPAFHPDHAQKMIWSEMTAETTPHFGLWIADLEKAGGGTGHYLCQDAMLRGPEGQTPCFGSQLRWPEASVGVVAWGDQNAISYLPLKDANPLEVGSPVPALRGTFAPGSLVRQIGQSVSFHPRSHELLMEAFVGSLTGATASIRFFSSAQSGGQGHELSLQGFFEEPQSFIPFHPGVRLSISTPQWVSW